MFIKKITIKRNHNNHFLIEAGIYSEVIKKEQLLYGKLSDTFPFLRPSKKFELPKFNTAIITIGALNERKKRLIYKTETGLLKGLAARQFDNTRKIFNGIKWEVYSIPHALTFE